MKNKIIILVLMLGLIGIVTAGILASWNSEIDLTKEQESRIKLSGNADEIKVSINQITCDDKTCWAWAKQKDVINSLWATDKEYCSSYNETNWECLSWTDKTVEMLQDEVKGYVKGRLGNWANAEINRSIEVEILTDEGEITNRK